METSEHVNNIFFPAVLNAIDGRIILCEISADIYNNCEGSMSLLGGFHIFKGILNSIRASEASSGHHKLMDRRIIMSAAACDAEQYYQIDGSSCLLALVLMDRALRYPETRTPRRVIATGAVEPDRRISAIPADKITDYLAKIENVDWQEGDIFVCPAAGLDSELNNALESLRRRGVDVRPIHHLRELEEPWRSATRTREIRLPKVTTTRALWTLAFAAVLLIAFLGSREAPPPWVQQETAWLPFEAALGVNVLLEPQGGGTPVRTLAGHIFARGDRVGLELESSSAGQVAVFDTSAGTSASPIPLAMAKIEEGRRLSLPTTGSWTLEGASGAVQTLAVAFAPCVDTACSPDFMTEAQAAVVQDHSNKMLSPPGRVALASPDGQAAVVRISLRY